jgi:hypothetical protein
MDKIKDESETSSSQDFFNINSHDDDCIAIAKECELLSEEYGVKIPKDQILSYIKLMFQFEAKFKQACSDLANLNIATLEDMMLEQRKIRNELDLRLMAELKQRMKKERDIIDPKNVRKGKEPKT